MPELPEVQTIVDGLIQQGLVGRRIVGASVFWPKTIATSTPNRFCRHITGKCITRIRRRGKFIIFELNDSIYCAVHLRMTGRFELTSSDDQPRLHIHVVLNIDDDRQLLFHDTRKFGRFYLTEQLDTIIGSLGPEPLGAKFTANWLTKKLMERHRQIKPLLLDQSFVAGLGNIYVDEALWRSQIHPTRSAVSLNHKEVGSLHRAIRYVLKKGILHAGTSLGSGLGNFLSPAKASGRNRDYLKVFRRTGQPCLKCGHLIERIVVGQRSTHICSHCQKGT